MSEPFIAEIRIYGFNFAPRGWALCDGQILPISQNQSLFSLLGTNFGGDGRTTFGLPDLRGRSPRHIGGTPGGRAGEENVQLTTAEIPSHSHGVQGTSNATDTTDPTDALFGSACSTLWIQRYERLGPWSRSQPSRSSRSGYT